MRPESKSHFTYSGRFVKLFTLRSGKIEIPHCSQCLTWVTTFCSKCLWLWPQSEVKVVQMEGLCWFHDQKIQILQLYTIAVSLGKTLHAPLYECNERAGVCGGEGLMAQIGSSLLLMYLKAFKAKIVVCHQQHSLERMNTVRNNWVSRKALCKTGTSSHCYWSNQSHL